MTSLQNSADGVAVVPSEGVATPAVASSSLVPVVDSVNAEKPPTDDEIEGTLAGLPGLPSNFGSTFSYVKNQGHEERTGFGLTFNASDTETTAVAAAASAAVSETAEEKEDEKPVGCWSSFVDFLYLGPRVVNEPEYTQLTKRAILIIISVTGILGPLTGSIYSPALPAVKADFQTTTEWVNGTLTAGVIALGVAPLFWAPASDRSGRRFILILSQICNIGGCFVCTFSPNVYVFLVGRIIMAAGSGAGLSVGAGVVADVYKREERGRAFGIFYLGPLIGPVIAPVIGGSITSTIGWRYIFVVSAGLAVFVLLVTFFFFPETLVYRRRHIHAPAPKVTAIEGKDAVVAVSAAPAAAKPPAGPPPTRNPFSAFVHLKHFFFLSPVLVGCATFGSFYALPSLVPLTWPEIYGYNAATIGLFLMSTGFGFIAGSLVGGWNADRIFKRYKNMRGGVVVAEDRLRSTALGMFTVPLGLLLYGWGVQGHLSAAVPTIGMFVLGFGSMIMSTSSNSYLLDCFTTSSAAVIAISNFCRFVAAGIVPLISSPIAHAIGQGWYFTILTFINLVTFATLVYVMLYGTAERVKSLPWSKSLETVRGDEIMKEAQQKAKQAPLWRRMLGLADVSLSEEDMEDVDRRARDRLGMAHPEAAEKEVVAKAAAAEEMVVDAAAKAGTVEEIVPEAVEAVKTSDAAN